MLQAKSIWHTCQKIIKKKSPQQNKLRILKVVGGVLDHLMGDEYKFYFHYKGLQIYVTKKFYDSVKCKIL